MKSPGSLVKSKLVGSENDALVGADVEVGSALGVISIVGGVTAGWIVVAGS
jgi:hypothetical protein